MPRSVILNATRRKTKTESASIDEIVAASEASFLVKSQRLEKYKKEHRHTSRLELLRSEWLRAHAALRHNAQDMEIDIERIRQDYGLNAPETVEVFGFTRDLKELRTMVQSVARLERGCAEEALIAQLLLRVRLDHENAVADLEKAEEEANREAIRSRRFVYKQIINATTVSVDIDVFVNTLVSQHLIRKTEEESDCFELAKAEILAEWQSQQEQWKNEDLEIEVAQEESICGWSQNEAALFDEVIRTATGVGLMARLRITLPEKSQTDLEARLSLVARQRRERHERRASTEARRKWIDDFKKKAESQIHAVAEETLRSKKLREEQRDLNSRRHELHDLVNRLRIDRDKREAQHAVESARHSLHQSEIQAQRQQKSEEEQTNRRAAVSAYKAALAAARADALQLFEEKSRKEETIKRKRLRSCEQRSAFRESLRDKRMADIELSKRKVADADAARLRALAKLAASVPYADAIANAVADIHKPTVAVIASRADNRPDPNTLTGLSYADASKVHGFSDEYLFRDVRFKIGLALRDAGISHTAAARDLVAPVRERNPILSA